MVFLNGINYRLESKKYVKQDFPQKDFCWIYRAPGGFLRHNNRAIAFVYEPRHLTYRASGRQPVEPSTREMQWGLALHNSKAPAMPEVSRMLSGLCCGFRKPPCALSFSLSFCFLAAG